MPHVSSEVSSEGPREPQILARRETPRGVEIDLRIAPDLVILAGHFPGLPIVPGVGLLDWAVLYAGRFLGRPDPAATRFQVKFRRIIQPGTDVTLTLLRLEGGRVQFEYRQAATIHASGMIAGADT